MPKLIIFILTFLGGVTAAVQPSINASLAKKTGVLESAAVSFAVGTLVLLLVVLFAGQPGLRHITDARWWELTGGFLGAFFVATVTLAIPHIGTTAAMTAIIAAQLITGLILDHYGLFGFTAIPMDFRRLAGAVCLAAGVLLIFRS